MQHALVFERLILLGLLFSPLLAIASKLPTSTVPKVAALQSNIGTEYPETYRGPLAFDQKWGIEAYQRVYPKMSYAEAELAVRDIDKRKALVNAIATHENATFAGSFYDPPTNTQVIYVTSAAAKASVNRQAMQRGVTHKVEIKPYSMAELRPIAQAFNRSLLESEREDYVAVANIKLNRVEVTVPDDRKLQHAHALLGADPRVVFTVNPDKGRQDHGTCYSRYRCTVPLRAGLSIGQWRSTRRADNNCSSGFTARSSDGADWLLTAAHCYSGPVPPYTTCVADRAGCWGHNTSHIGQIREIIRYGGVDVARMRIENYYWTTHDYGYMYSTQSGYDKTVDVDYGIVSYSEIDDGDWVCLQARHNDDQPIVNPCGVIRGSDYGYRVVDGFDACPGDSGGGWYSPQGRGRVAYGIHQGSLGDEDTCHRSSDSRFTTLSDYYEEFNYLHPFVTIRVHTR